ncbi:MAG: DUF1801 domain-containing protein [Myxococcota bacterium]
MPPRKSPAVPADTPQINAAVTAFIAALDHPLKPEIEAVRHILLGVSPTIGEAIKWNAPSFRTTEYFATFHLRSRDKVQLVFHLGAKVRDASGMQITDPLIKWLATDRCMVTLGAGDQIAANRAAFEALVRSWIGHV